MKKLCEICITLISNKAMHIPIAVPTHCLRQRPPPVNIHQLDCDVIA